MTVLSRPQFIEAIKQNCRNHSQLSTLLFAEINHATQVISLIQGLEAEESLIQSVEKFIVNSVSQYQDSQIGRIESNRFGIILPLPVEDSLDLAHHLTRKLDQQPVTINGSTHYPKLIIGVTPLAPVTTEPELAIAAADEALYQARRIGHSIVQLIEPDDPRLRQYQQFLKLLPQLRKGLREKAFILYTQPIIALNGQQTIKKAEVLLRYRDENIAIHLPERFLSTAGLFHVSREIDLYVVHHFCRFIQKNPDQKTMYSINISGNTVRYTPFFTFVEREFQFHRVDPEKVCFEMTENVADKDMFHATKLMSLLKKQLGCHLSLDDIGIGSSNLSNLPRFNVDYFKIDGSYIKKMLDDPYSELVVQFITTAAKQLKKEVVAEYVEQPEQLEKLISMGVDYAQGYLLGKPEILFDPAELEAVA